MSDHDIAAQRRQLLSSAPSDDALTRFMLARWRAEPSYLARIEALARLGWLPAQRIVGIVCGTCDRLVPFEQCQPVTAYALSWCHQPNCVHAFDRSRSCEFTGWVRRALLHPVLLPSMALERVLLAAHGRVGALRLHTSPGSRRRRAMLSVVDQHLRNAPALDALDGRNPFPLVEQARRLGRSLNGIGIVHQDDRDRGPLFGMRDIAEAELSSGVEEDRLTAVRTSWLCTRWTASVLAQTLTMRRVAPPELDNGAEFRRTIAPLAGHALSHGLYALTFWKRMRAASRANRKPARSHSRTEVSLGELEEVTHADVIRDTLTIPAVRSWLVAFVTE